MEGEPDLLQDTDSNLGAASNITQEGYNQHNNVESLAKKATGIIQLLEKDYKAADLKWSLFVAAAHSFKSEYCLKPFPPAFVNNGSKDLDQLLNVIGDTPPLDIINSKLESLDKLINNSDVINLLFFVIAKNRESYLKTVPVEEHNSVLAKVASTAPAAKPQYIFEVVSTSKCPGEKKFRALAKNYSTFFAYHGSRLENFHSILYYGLQQHLNKNKAFGSGTYLSSELCVTLPYSQTGFAWGGSCLGSNLSCVAMCEVINAPEGIDSHLTEGDTSDHPNVVNKKYVPDKYYIVTNDDLLRLRYVLVYAEPGSRRNFHPIVAGANNDGVRLWFAQHKLLSVLIGYGVMLAGIGFANSNAAQFYFRLVMKKVEGALTSIKL